MSRDAQRLAVSPELDSTYRYLVESGFRPIRNDPIGDVGG
jgi:hypothetical protein